MKFARILSSFAAAAILLTAVFTIEIKAQENSSATATGKTYGQALVDSALARHPEIATLAMHVTPPNGANIVIIASSIRRIGKKADEDDMSVVNTGMPLLEVNKTGDRFEIFI